MRKWFICCFAVLAVLPMVLAFQAASVQGRVVDQASGIGKGGSFRTGPDGFGNPGKDGAIYAKTTKSFQTGIFSVGGYFGTSTGGYTFAYPGAPFTVYGSVRFMF